MKLKLFRTLSLCIAMYSGGLAQAPEPTLRQTIERFVFGGYIEGWGLKQMRRAGDSTAVTLTKVLSDRVLSKTQIEDSLYTLEMAFSNSTLIENPADRQPGTALFVLRYLELCTQDPAVKLKIEATRNHLLTLVTSP